MRNEKGHDTLYFIFLNVYFEIPLVSVMFSLLNGLRGRLRSLEVTGGRSIILSILLSTQFSKLIKTSVNGKFTQSVVRIRRKALKVAEGDELLEFSYTSTVEHIERKSSAIVTWK